MAEGVVAQIKDIPGTAVSSVRNTPVLAFGIMLLVILVVLLIEAYKPGLLTNPMRKVLTTLGLKSA